MSVVVLASSSALLSCPHERTSFSGMYCTREHLIVQGLRISGGCKTNETIAGQCKCGSGQSLQRVCQLVLSTTSFKGEKTSGARISRKGCRHWHKEDKGLDGGSVQQFHL